MLAKYRKKPVEIYAVQFFRAKWDSMASPDFHNAVCVEPDEVSINTLEGKHIVTEGDFIICGVKGEFYPCKPDIFEMTYEKVAN